MFGISRKLLLLLGLVSLALFLVGFVTGPLGAAFFGTKPLLPSPELHLPGQEVMKLGGFPITNTVLAAWITSLFLLAFFFLATRGMRPVPGRFQNLAELMLEMLLNFMRSVLGKWARTAFPIVATIFLFVLFNAWLSILPVYGPIGFLDEQGHIKTVLLRNASTDINVPLAIALVAFSFVEYLGMRTIGTFHYLGQFFNVRDILRGRVLIGFINLFIGGLEVLSHFIRILSFTIRLFGNMTAGKALLLISAFLVPFVFTIPFYLLELLVGFVQALIFAGLTLTFAAIAVSPHGEEGHG